LSKWEVDIKGALDGFLPLASKGVMKNWMAFVTSDGRPSISTPRPQRFTPNPVTYARPDSPDWALPAKKRGFRGWVRSNSRLFWIVLGLCLVFIAGTATVLSLFLKMHHSPIPAIQNPETPAVPTDKRTIPHSFLVDVDTAEDEDTRAAVTILKDEVDGRIDLKSSKN
jgi:hypothetical protein